jgi:hypothetical protein
MLVGVITIGQCFELFQGGCATNNCPNNTPAERCNAQLPDCQISNAATCDTSYTVVQGDDAWAVATLYGLTLEALEEENPSVDFSIELQPNQVLCVHQTFTSSPLCEGYQI